MTTDEFLSEQPAPEEIEEIEDEVRKLYRDWEEAVREEDEVTSKVSGIEAALAQLGIDPESPPEWVYSE